MVIITLKNGTRFYMDGILKSNIDSLVYNIPNDWDFVLVISGNNMVRIGKSVFAQQVGAYAAEKLKTAWSLNNITMTGKEMIDFANKAPKNSVIVYDEAAEGLRAAKNIKEVTENLLDFFDECGQLNHIFIIVAPNFFRLKQDVVIERSELLLNVYRTGVPAKNELGDPVIKLKRGFFQFFNRNQKQKLYERWLKTKTQSYSNVTDSVGHFSDIYTVDRIAYVEKKRQTLKRLSPTKKPQFQEYFYKIIYKCVKEWGWTAQKTKDMLKLPHTIGHISQIVRLQEGLMSNIEVDIDKQIDNISQEKEIEVEVESGG